MAKAFLVPVCVLVLTAVAGAQGVDPDVSNYYGVVSYRGGDLFRAIAHFQNAVAGNPRNREAFFNLGVALSETGDCVEGERVFRRLETIDPAYPGLGLELGNCLVRLGRFDDASKVLLKAVAENPAYPGSNFLLGYALVSAGKFQEALQPLSVATAAPALAGPANYYLSVAHERLGDREKSLSRLRLAAQSPTTEEGRRAAAGIEAAEACARADRKSPVSWGMLVQTGAAFDSNVSSLPDAAPPQVPGFSTSEGAASQWGARGEIYLAANAEYPFDGGHSIAATAGWYTNYHFLPVEAITPRAEFDANGYDLMLYHVNAAYRYKGTIGNARIVPALELGFLDSYTDAFGGAVHGDAAAYGPHHMISDFDLAPGVAFSFHRRESTRVFYRFRVEGYYPSVADPAVDGRGALNHQIGFEQNVVFFEKDTFALRFAYESNAADGIQWSYGGILLGADLRVTAFDVIELRAGGELFSRDFPDSSYQMTDGSGGKGRSDLRLTGYAGPDFLLGSRVRLELKYVVVKNGSNIEDRFDYLRHMGMLRIGVTI